MGIRVGVWGLGNMGRAAVRCIAGHPDLELAAVISGTRVNVGRDAGERAGVGPLGMPVSSDRTALHAAECRAVVYACSGDLRPDPAAEDVRSCLREGMREA